MSMLGLLVASTAATVGDIPPRPVALFEDACLSGEARFRDDEIERVAPAILPAEARYMLNFVSAEEPSEGLIDAIPSNRLPKTLLRLEAEQPLYLLIPDADAERGFRSMCAMFVYDDLYFEGKQSVARFAYGTDERIEEPRVKETAFGRGVSGHVVTVVRHEGWTLLAAVKNPEFSKMGNPSE